MIFPLVKIEWRSVRLRVMLCDTFNCHIWESTEEKNPYDSSGSYYKKTCRRCGEEEWYVDHERFQKAFDTTRNRRRNS